MNTTAFAEEVALDSTDEVAVTVDAVAVDTYTGDNGRKIGKDDLNTDEYTQVPDNWNINADPGTWDTATALLSVNDIETADFNPDLSNYEHYYNDGAIDWVVYSPFSYFFNPVDERLVDGKVVHPVGTKSEDNYIYRAIKAGDNTYVLVRVDAEGADQRLDLKVFRKDKDNKWITTPDSYNTRYNGNEPVLTFDGRKMVAVPANNGKDKKGEHGVFDVDAVLVKYENGKTTLIKGLGVKSLKFKNNVNASLPDDYEAPHVDTYAFGKGGDVFGNGYKWSYDENDKTTGIAFEAPSYKAQLTNQENANFKGQPSFTIDVNLKGDAAKYSKDVKKALKSEDATFNFEIRQLNIGNYQHGTGTAWKTVKYAYSQDTAENEDKAQTEYDKLYWSYVNKYADFFLAEGRAYENVTTKEAATARATQVVLSSNGAGGVYNDYDDNGNFVGYIGYIRFNNAPLYVDDEIDAMFVSENGVGYNTELIAQGEGDLKDPEKAAKSIKFGKNNKVSAKLRLRTVQWVETETNMSVYGPNGDVVSTWTEVVTNVKTTYKAGGKADVFVKGLTATEGEGENAVEYPLAACIGQNDLTGAVTMRVKTDAHGNEYVSYGYYRTDDFYSLSSVED